MRPTQNNVFISGASGSGKTCFLVDWLVNDLIPWSDAHVITNMPVGKVPDCHFEPPNYEGETFVDRMSKATGHDCSKRITYLPEETINLWELGQGGAWDLETKGETYLILDEFANFVNFNTPDQLRERWVRYLAKARHANIHNLMISQSSQKIPRNIFLEFGEKWQLSDTATRVLPRLECSEGDLNQIISKALGTEFARTMCMVRINEGGTWSAKDEMPTHLIRRTKATFRLYDSFSAPETGGESENRSQIWQRLSWFKLCIWFIDRNKQAVFVVSQYFAFFFVAVAVICWLGLGMPMGFGEKGKGGTDVLEIVENEAGSRGSFGGVDFERMLGESVQSFGKTDFNRIGKATEAENNRVDSVSFD